MIFRGGGGGGGEKTGEQGGLGQGSCIWVCDGWYNLQLLAAHNNYYTYIHLN